MDALNVLPSTIINNVSKIFANSTIIISPLLAINNTINNNNNNQYEHGIMNNEIVKGLFLFAYIVVFFSCVIGNSMILIVIIANRSMRTVTNFFLANLAIADLLVGVFCVCQNAVHFVVFEHGTWVFGRVLCHAYIYILHMIPNSSAGILVLLSIERFIAVLRPMLVHHLMTKRVLIICAILVWLFSAIFNLPYLIAVQYIELKISGTSKNYGICTRRFLVMNDVNILKVVSTINLILWYIFPLTILLFIYISIGFVLMRTTDDNSISRSAHNQNRLSKTQLNRNRRPSYMTKIEIVDTRKRVIRLVVVIVLAFALLSAPRYIYFTWSVWRDANSPRCLNCLAALIQPTTFLLMFINSGINPFLYAFLSQRFRQAISETFTCPKTKKNRKMLMMRSLHNRQMSELREHIFDGFTNSEMNHYPHEDWVMESAIS